jgi:hypothetical protein
MNNNQLTEFKASTDVLGFPVREEGSDIEGVGQAGLHANDDVEGLN